MTPPGTISPADAMVNAAPVGGDAERAALVERLRGLMAKATPGPWYVDKGLMNDALRITTYLRESGFGDREPEGSIGCVYPKRTSYKKDKHSGETRIRDIPHARARDDAALIVAAVNALPVLLDALSETRGAA